LSGYGRIDLRVTPSGEVFCLEANPNPSIEKDGDFALSAIKSGMTYDEMVQKIINLALTPESSDSPRAGTRRKKK
jgi:D-alanine-D-alanine ligase